MVYVLSVTCTPVHFYLNQYLFKPIFMYTITVRHLYLFKPTYSALKISYVLYTKLSCWTNQDFVFNNPFVMYTLSLNMYTRQMLQLTYLQTNINTCVKPSRHALAETFFVDGVDIASSYAFYEERAELSKYANFGGMVI